MKTLPPRTPEIDLPVKELVLRYVEGESTRALGRAYGAGRETIRRRLLAAGVPMRPRAQLGNKHALGQHPPGGPLHICQQGYLGTYDRTGNRCAVHRAHWEACHGPIPQGYIVHHINGDTLDNAVDNLACMTAGEHSRLHRRKR